MAKMRSEPGGGFLPTRISKKGLFTALETKVIEAVIAATRKTGSWVPLRDLFSSTAERRTAFRLGKHGVFALKDIEFENVLMWVRNPHMPFTE